MLTDVPSPLPHHWGGLAPCLPTQHTDSRFIYTASTDSKHRSPTAQEGVYMYTAEQYHWTRHFLVTPRQGIPGQGLPRQGLLGNLGAPSQGPPGQVPPEQGHPEQISSKQESPQDVHRPGPSEIGHPGQYCITLEGPVDLFCKAKVLLAKPPCGQYSYYSHIQSFPTSKELMSISTVIATHCCEVKCCQLHPANINCTEIFVAVKCWLMCYVAVYQAVQALVIVTVNKTGHPDHQL